MLTLGHLSIKEEKKETVVYFSIAQMTTEYAKLHTIKRLNLLAMRGFETERKIQIMHFLQFIMK